MTSFTTAEGEKKMLDKAVNFLNNRYFIAVVVLLFLLGVFRSFRRAV